MSSFNVDKRIVTLPTKAKKKFEITKPSYLSSESSNKIIQTIEAKIKSKKKPFPKPARSLKTLSKPNINTKIIPNKKTKSAQTLSSSFNTIAATTTTQTPKHLITVSKPFLSPKVVSTKVYIMNKRKISSEDNFKSLSSSSSFRRNEIKNSKLNNRSAYINTHSNSNNIIISSLDNKKRLSIENCKMICRTPRTVKDANPSKSYTSFTTKQVICTKTNNIEKHSIRQYKNSYDHISSFQSKEAGKNYSGLSKLISNSPSCSSRKKDSNYDRIIEESQDNQPIEDENTKIVKKKHAKIIYASDKQIKIDPDSFDSPHNAPKAGQAANEGRIIINQPPIVIDKILPTPLNTMSATINALRSNSIYKRISKIDSYTKAGYSSLGVEKINQDNYFITQHFLNIPEQYLLGVCDGHGENGHLASEFIVNSLPEKLLDIFLYENTNLDTFGKINECFVRLHKELTDSNDIDTRFSGTTCVSTIISKDKIICSNLGDSRAVLARYDKGSWNALDLSRDHKASEGDENQRIIKKGGRIASYIDEKTQENIGPQRVWLKEANLPGLAMTRSFGDQIAHCIGVISEPEIKDYIFNGTEKFIVLASDGIWEFIDSIECVHMVKDYYMKGDVSGACFAIVEEAFNRWIKEEESVDDITVVIAFLE